MASLDASGSTDNVLPLLPITKPRTLRAVKALTLDTRSVFICSYPKSGTTWLQFVLYTLCTKGKRELDHISSYCPFLENDKIFDFPPPAESADETVSVPLASPFKEGHEAIGWQIFNTHLWWEMLPKSQESDGRYIYVVREPHDVAWSFFQHLSHQAPEDGGFEGDWPQFLYQWCAGEIAFGKWAAHIQSYMQSEALSGASSLRDAARDPRILVLSYDEMKRDIGKVCQRIVAHCGIEITEAEIEECLPLFDVTYMKENNEKFAPRSVEWVDRSDGFTFIRKGRSGDSRSAFRTDGCEALMTAMLENSFPEGHPRYLQQILGVTSPSESS